MVFGDTLPPLIINVITCGRSSLGASQRQANRFSSELCPSLSAACYFVVNQSVVAQPIDSHFYLLFTDFVSKLTVHKNTVLLDKTCQAHRPCLIVLHNLLVCLCVDADVTKPDESNFVN